jgi:hypothetical protein
MGSSLTDGLGDFLKSVSEIFLMNKTLALDPNAVESPTDWHKIYPFVGQRHGLFVADFPRRWEREFIGRLRELDPTVWGFWDEERITNTLIELREQNSFISLQSPYDKSRSWFENFLSVSEKNRDGVIAFGSRDDSLQPPTLDSLDPTSLEVQTTLSGKLTPERLLSELRPYLRSSGKLALVDRHHYLLDSRGSESSFLKFLRLLLLEVQSSRCHEILVYARHDPEAFPHMRSNDLLARQLEKLLAGQITPTYGIKYVCLSEHTNDRTTDLHRRMIVTNHVAFVLADSITGGTHSKSITRVRDKDFIEGCQRNWIDGDHGLEVKCCAEYMNLRGC